jgi:hypothetical protein
VFSDYATVKVTEGQQGSGGAAENSAAAVIISVTSEHIN